MTFKVADRVKESCTSPGTGTVTLGGAVTGFQSFSSAIGASNTTYYVIADQSGANWEVGLGTVGAGGTTLARTTVLASSNGGSLTNFASGSQYVWVDYPSVKAILQDPTGVATAPVFATNSSTSTTPTLSFNGSNSVYAGGATIANNYLQFLLQNKSGTSGASTNYVLSNDLGTDSSYYGEFGMNSSTFSASTPSDFFSLNNGVYFSGHDGDITVGSGNGFKYYLAWGTTGQSAHVINASGALGFSTNLGTTPALSGITGYGTAGQVPISAGSGAAPTWSSTPTLVGTNFSGIPYSALTGTVPTWNQNTTGTASNVTGTVAVGNGGTGQTSYTNGQLLIGNSTGNTLTKATLTAGAGISITNGNGAITITNTAIVYLANYLIVAGGGGAGNYGGGGGAGGLLSGSALLTGGTTYSFTVGGGGAGSSTTTRGSSGANSTGLGFTAIGGGGGGSNASSLPNAQGGDGGSGGGGSSQNYSSAPPGAGTSGQGFSGGYGSGTSGNANVGDGGGGGATAAGGAGNTNVGGNGGAGAGSTITGSLTYYGGGGGGNVYSGTPGTGGIGGGGNGVTSTSTGNAGTVNTGGGGGGGVPGGSGGSGVVIISVPTVNYTGVTTGSPTVTTSGANTILKFTASGSYTA